MPKGGKSMNLVSLVVRAVTWYGLVDGLTTIITVVLLGLAAQWGTYRRRVYRNWILLGVVLCIAWLVMLDRGFQSLLGGWVVVAVAIVSIILFALLILGLVEVTNTILRARNDRRKLETFALMGLILVEGILVGNYGYSAAIWVGILGLLIYAAIRYWPQISSGFNEGFHSVRFSSRLGGVMSRNLILVNMETGRLLDSHGNDVYTWEANWNGFDGGNQQWVFSGKVGARAGTLKNHASGKYLKFDGTDLYLADQGDKFFMYRNYGAVRVKHEATGTYLDTDHDKNVTLKDENWSNHQNWILATIA
jgi:hypothetical protein